MLFGWLCQIVLLALVKSTFMRGGCLCNVLIIKKMSVVGSCIFPLITCSSRNYNKKYIIFANGNMV